MRIKLLTFRYSATLGGFDDTALEGPHPTGTRRPIEQSRLRGA